jgi:nucleoside-diphosphate-sugar epimerase
MKILVAGAGGVVGRRLIPILVEAGHSVVGMTRSPAKTAAIRAGGAEPVVGDALNAKAVMAAVQRVEPEVVVHELTAIPVRLNFRKFDREFELTNRLRTEGTDHLLAAAHAVGTRRFVAQSFAGWPYARQGGPVKTEEDPLDPSPPAALRRSLAAIRYLEAAVLGAQSIEGIVLRYGAFYGPGTSLGEGGSILEDIRHRRFPMVGCGTGIWSFIHINDAARATLAAIERGPTGVYNIVDDDPAPVSEWLPALATAISAKTPRRVPIFVARLAVGEHGVVVMTEIRGASNAKAKCTLGWQPVWASWRDGFRIGLSAASARSVA